MVCAYTRDNTRDTKIVCIWLRDCCDLQLIVQRSADGWIERMRLWSVQAKLSALRCAVSESKRSMIGRTAASIAFIGRQLIFRNWNLLGYRPLSNMTVSLSELTSILRIALNSGGRRSIDSRGIMCTRLTRGSRGAPISKFRLYSVSTNLKSESIGGKNRSWW